MNSIVPRLKELQERYGVFPRKPKKGERIGFAFSTKDRIEFTLQTLKSIDEKGIDIIWIDGSDSKEARKLPQTYKFKNARLVESHLDIKGGPDRAIEFALKRLVDLKYDYCGLLENDILYKKGWAAKALDLFRLAAEEGIAAGAATIRNVHHRILEYRSDYTINWNIGAGMILFSRPAAQIIAAHYPHPTNSWKVYKFYAELLGLDLSVAEDLWRGRIDRELSPDFSFEMLLYQQGLSSIGSIPSFAVRELETGVNPEERGTTYVSGERRNFLVFPNVKKRTVWQVRLFDPLLSFSWFFLRFKPIRKLMRQIF